MIALHLLLLLQEPAASSAPAAPPAAVQSPAKTSDPAAVALLAKLAAVQYGAGATRAVDGFNVQLVWREKGDQPQEFELGLQYVHSPAETVEIRILDSARNTEVRKGFDGKRYWLEQGEEPRLDLGGHEYDKDREEIVEAIDFAADLLQVLDLHALARQAQGLRLTVTESKERMLTGQLLRREVLWEFNLLLPASDPAGGPQPQELRLRQPNPDPLTAAEQPFLVDRRFKLLKFKRFKERSVPQEIQEFQPDSEDAARILEIHDLQWADLPLPAPPPPKPADPPPAAPK